jgi:murein DD-endopeptidase
MFKSFLCVVMVGLFGITSSASANFNKRTTSLAPFSSSLQAVPQPTIESVVDRAHELLGTAYKWGGSSQEQGFDCSGLLVYLFKTEANIQLPRTTAAMQRSTAATIRRNALKAGDAVFFKGNGGGQVSHVGLYIGEGKFIHSPRAGKHIRIDSLSNSYWNKNYTTAKRFHTAG